MIKWNPNTQNPPYKDRLLILVRFEGVCWIVPGYFKRCDDGFHEHFQAKEFTPIFRTNLECMCICSCGECLELGNVEGWILLESLIPSNKDAVL